MDGGGYREMHEVWYVEGTSWSPVVETVAREEAVGIYCDGLLVEEISCTPEDLEDLAVGYVFTSGVLADLDECSCIEAVSGNRRFGIRPCDLRALCASRAAQALRSRGIEADGAPFGVSPEAVHRASFALLDAQRMHRGTGATHAAAFADFEGRYRCVREDIGRHNAVDKLIGALLREGVDPLSGFVHLSSRCALDLVRKCATYGIRLVSTVSAPTSAVLEFANERGITLCAFARNGHFTVYTHPETLVRR